MREFDWAVVLVLVMFALLTWYFAAAGCAVENQSEAELARSCALPHWPEAALGTIVVGCVAGRVFRLRTLRYGAFAAALAMSAVPWLRGV